MNLKRIKLHRNWSSIISKAAEPNQQSHFCHQDSPVTLQR